MEEEYPRLNETSCHCGDQVATLSIESIWCGALRELQQHSPELEQNVSLQLTRCNCGEYHVQVVLIRPCVLQLYHLIMGFSADLNLKMTPS